MLPFFTEFCRTPTPYHIILVTIFVSPSEFFLKQEMRKGSKLERYMADGQMGRLVGRQVGKAMRKAG